MNPDHRICRACSLTFQLYVDFYDFTIEKFLFYCILFLNNWLFHFIDKFEGHHLCIFFMGRVEQLTHFVHGSLTDCGFKPWAAEIHKGYSWTPVLSLIEPLPSFFFSLLCLLSFSLFAPHVILLLTCWGTKSNLEHKLHPHWVSNSVQTTTASVATGFIKMATYNAPHI